MIDVLSMLGEIYKHNEQALGTEICTSWDREKLLLANIVDSAIASTGPQLP